MSKKIVSILLAVVMILAMGTVALVSVNAADETKTYYFLMPNGHNIKNNDGTMSDLNWYTNSDVNTAGIYWWTPTEPYKWPGQAATKVAGSEDVYSAEVPADTPMIDWNNFLDGGEDETLPIYTQACQTSDIVSQYYDGAWNGEEPENDLYPDGVETFDGMIYVVDPDKIEYNFNGKASYGGEWYYYYGIDAEGQPRYGTSKEDPEPSTPQPSSDPAPALKELEVNGNSYHVGDTINYTYFLTADKLIEDAEAVISYDETKLKLLNSSESNDDFTTCLPVISQNGSTDWNSHASNYDIKITTFTARVQHDFTKEGIFVTLNFLVTDEGKTDILMDMQQLTGKDDYIYAEDSEIIKEFGQKEVVTLVDCPAEHKVTTPESKPSSIPTTPSTPVASSKTPTPSDDETTTVPQTTKDASGDQTPTDATSADDGDGGGSVQTGDIQFGVSLLIILLAATGAMLFVRKKIEG